MKTILFFWFCFFSCVSQARIYINVGAPQKIKKSSLASAEFKLKKEDQSLLSPQELAIQQSMSHRLRSNMKLSGYFRVLSAKAHLEQTEKLSPIPYLKNNKGFRWENWRVIGADFLFFGEVVLSPQEDLSVEIYFYNINAQKRILKKSYKGNRLYANGIVDQISNDLVRSITGKKSIFQTQILAVRSINSKQKELFVMDWNGENKKRISYHRSIVLSPSWANKRDKILYSVFGYNKKTKQALASLFLYEFKSNKTTRLSTINKTSLGSDFLPGDKEILLSQRSKYGLMDIFKFHLQNLTFSPLTKGPAGKINVEPVMHPKTKQIAFSSDRNGKTMIYVMSRKGTNIQQITFAGNHNASPDWHPYKNQMVFSGLSNGKMDLFLISAEGTGLKRLTRLKRQNGTWANSESPSFSPDGQFVVFRSDVSGSYQLYIMNLEDLSIERISFDRYNYQSPKWSPY